MQMSCPMSVFFDTPLGIKLLGRLSPSHRLMGPAPSVEILLVGEWVVCGCGISRKLFAHSSTQPQTGKPPTLRTVGKAQLTLRYRVGSAFFLDLQRKESRFSKL